MSGSPEWAVMSPDGRRRATWQAGHDTARAGGVVRELVGDRWGGNSLDAGGNDFRYRVRVRGLTAAETADLQRQLGAAATWVDLVPVERSWADLERVQREVRAFVAGRPDAAAHSASSIDVRDNAVRVWVRKEAPELWQAVSARFGAAVVVTWGASSSGW